MIRKKILGMFAALAILLTGGLVAATPNSAMAQPAGCLSGQACLYVGGNYSGNVLNLAWSTYYDNGACQELDNIYPYTFDTTTSSAYNDYGSGYRLIMYYGYGCTSSTHTLYGQNGVNFVGTGWDNHVRSFRISL